MDTNCKYPLLKNDYWLRKRNGVWELKYPMDEVITQPADLQIDSINPKNRPPTDMYHETSNVEEIVSRLKIICKLEPGCCDRHLDQYVSDGTLWPFAEINTIRKEYREVAVATEDGKIKMPHNKCYPTDIVIDITDWDYIIGEIEIIVKNKDEADAAALQIERIATKLGLSAVQEGSKVIDYIKRYRPCAYNIYRQRSGKTILQT